MCTRLKTIIIVVPAARQITTRRAESFLRRRAKDFISFRETMMRTDKTTFLIFTTI